MKKYLTTFVFALGLNLVACRGTAKAPKAAAAHTKSPIIGGYDGDSDARASRQQQRDEYSE